MFRIFIIVVCVLLVLRWLLKPYLRFVVQQTVNKMNDPAQKFSPPKPEGTITVEKKSIDKSKGHQAPKDDDYIDYTELK